MQRWAVLRQERVFKQERDALCLSVPGLLFAEDKFPRGYLGCFLKDFIKGGFVLEATLEGNPVEGEVLKGLVGDFGFGLFHAVFIDKLLEVEASLMVDELREVFGVGGEFIRHFFQGEIWIEEEAFGFEEVAQFFVEEGFFYSPQRAGAVPFREFE